MIPTGQRPLQNWVMFYHTQKSVDHRQIWNSWTPSFNLINFARGIRWLTSWPISSSPPLRLMSYHQVCIQQFKTIQDVQVLGEEFHKQDQWWAKLPKALKDSPADIQISGPFGVSRYTHHVQFLLFYVHRVLTIYLACSCQHFGWESFRHRRPRDHTERTGTTFPSSSMHLCVRCSNGYDAWQGRSANVDTTLYQTWSNAINWKAQWIRRMPRYDIHNIYYSGFRLLTCW